MRVHCVCLAYVRVQMLVCHHTIGDNARSGLMQRGEYLGIVLRAIDTLRLGADLSHDANGLEGVVTAGGLARQHHTVRTCTR